MARPETVRFELNQYQTGIQVFENDLVAQLPGLLITQFTVQEEPSSRARDKIGLRFDFVDDWYSVLAFLDDSKRPTGHYLVSMQTPLSNEDGIWKGNDLVLKLEVLSQGDYLITCEEEFYAAVEGGWMRVYSAAKAREALHKICLMLEEGCLPQEVMDAVGG